MTLPKVSLFFCREHALRTLVSRTHALGQLLDPRSQVVKEVCHVTSSVASKMPERFRASEVVTTLIKLTYVTIRAIAEPASECLDNLVRGTPNPPPVSSLFEPASECLDGLLRPLSVRTRCAEPDRLVRLAPRSPDAVPSLLT